MSKFNTCGSLPVMATITTYQGADHIKETFTTLRTASLKEFPVFAIDNGSKDKTVDALCSINDASLEVKSLDRNVGVAAALNIALRKARFMGVRWLFVLDQDSLCAPGCLDTLYQAAEKQSAQNEKTGAVCPDIYSRAFPEIIHLPYAWNGSRLEPLDPEQESVILQVDSGISSGTLYLVEALDNIGGFRDDFFVDFVDHECHLRMKKAGWRMYWIRTAMVAHVLGKHQKMTPEGLWIEHDPWRYYYMVRNMIETHRTLGGKRAVLTFLLDLYRHVYKLLKNGQEPKKCIGFMLKGILHGFAGRFGPLDTRN